MVTQWEAIAEAGISDDQLIKFADSCGMTGVDMPEFVTILGAYCGRKALRVDLWDGTFLDAPSTSIDTSAFFCVECPLLGPQRAAASCSRFSRCMNTGELCRMLELRKS